MSDAASLLLEAREKLEALWDCTCNVNPGLLPDEREECERCELLGRIDKAIS